MFHATMVRRMQQYSYCGTKAQMESGIAQESIITPEETKESRKQMQNMRMI